MGYTPVVYLAFALTLFSSVRGQCSSSGITLIGTSGSFSSPNYPSNYANRQTCTWIITVPQGHLVRLSFESFQLESCALPSPVCSCDHLEVRDGSVASSERLGRYCGDEYPAAVQSSGRFMWIEFCTDLFSNEKGFFATYTAVDTRCPNNRNNDILRGTNGSFTSPGFPLSYPVSVKCTWIIEVPEDYQVQLTFTTFQLENCAISLFCTCDHVQARDGQDENSKKLQTLCGDNVPPTLRIRSSGRYMWVEFDSDSKAVGNGFDASFKAVHSSECPTNGVLRDENGSFTSPGFPSGYPGSVRCSWIIEVPENHKVELTFDTFQLASCAVSLSCSCGHVEVRDGRSAGSEKLKTICGDEKPPAIRSSERYLWVEFGSDWRKTSKGFYASFKAVPVYKCPKNVVLKGTNGSFTSPKYPLNYPNDVTCTWIIEVPENHFVELTFETLDLEDCLIYSSKVCTCDHVEIRDGKDGKSEELERLCGGSEHSSVKSTGRYMWVEFESDSKETRKGFKATFKAGENVFYCDTWTGWSVGKGPCTGITAGVVLVVVVMFALGYWCYRKSRILSVV
ncbi:bone morphogenetic protein 1-like [Oculina patagonica]